METYWEVRQPEPVSPELVLVDPVLREKLISQSRWDEISRPPSPADPPPPAAPRTRGAQLRRSHVVAWGLVTTSCAATLAIAMLALSQTPGRAPTPPPPAAPVVAVVAGYTPPSPAAAPRSEAQKRELADLLRSPMRDPFAPATAGG